MVAKGRSPSLAQLSHLQKGTGTDTFGYWPHRQLLESAWPFVYTTGRVWGTEPGNPGHGNVLSRERCTGSRGDSVSPWALGRGPRSAPQGPPGAVPVASFCCKMQSRWTGTANENTRVFAHTCLPGVGPQQLSLQREALVQRVIWEMDAGRTGEADRLGHSRDHESYGWLRCPLPPPLPLLVPAGPSVHRSPWQRREPGLGLSRRKCHLQCCEGPRLRWLSNECLSEAAHPPSFFRNQRVNCSRLL